MNLEQKNALINAFVRHRFSKVQVTSNLLHASLIEPIGSLIDELAVLDDAAFLMLEQLSPEALLFRPFFAIVNAALQFTETAIPVFKSIDRESLARRLMLEKEIWALPNVNFTARLTAFKPYDAQNYFYELKQQATFKLILLLKANDPMLALNTSLELTRTISECEKKWRKTTPGVLRSQYQHELYVLQDLDKIQQLHILSIPHEAGQLVDYCILAEAVAGVTPKLALARVDEVIVRLEALLNTRDLSIDDYVANRATYTVSVSAILKQAKHGQSTAVLREAIALNISRILGFHTTRAIMVSHQGYPALLVLFDEIKLLSDFAAGLDETLILPSSLDGIASVGDSYLNHSSIVAHGHGLHADLELESFGAMMAYAYLCNDPDFIGAHNQNKAIIHGRQLYVFDQSVMSRESLQLDTRLNLEAIGINKYLRHFKGRNKSLIEDADFESKFQSIVTVFENRSKINGLMVAVLCSLHQQAVNLSQALKGVAIQKTHIKALQASLAELHLLEKDALMIRATLHSRFETLLQRFPSFNGQALTMDLFLLHQKVIKHSLIFEKLINKPLLFTQDGRPYKHPWTDVHRCQIKAIEEQDGLITLHFDELDVNYVKWLLSKADIMVLLECASRQGCFRIPQVELFKIHERCIFKECMAFDLQYNYLNEQDLSYVIEQYPAGRQSVMQAKVQAYQRDINIGLNPIDKARSIIRVLNDLQQFMMNYPIFKVLALKLQLDAHQRLRFILSSLSSAELMLNVAEGFDVAIRFDCLHDFNQVLAQSIIIGFTEGQNATLSAYLRQCTVFGQEAPHYHHARNASQSMRLLSQHYFKPALESSMARVMHRLGTSVSRQVETAVLRIKIDADSSAALVVIADNECQSQPSP